jgi:hypothetical protein
MDGRLGHDNLDRPGEGSVQVPDLVWSVHRAHGAGDGDDEALTRLVHVCSLITHSCLQRHTVSDASTSSQKAAKFQKKRRSKMKIKIRKRTKSKGKIKSRIANYSLGWSAQI